MNREEALRLVRKYTKKENLVKHILAVAAAMKSYAKKFGEDEQRWEVCGILHDLDYEKMGDDHPSEWGREKLQEEGVDEDIIEAIMLHGERDRPDLRETKMAKALFAVDELTGLVVACSLVRPDKIGSLKVSSVKKKMKKKDFASAISRENIRQGAKELDVTLEEHIGTVVEAMKGIRDDMGL